MRLPWLETLDHAPPRPALGPLTCLPRAQELLQLPLQRAVALGESPRLLPLLLMLAEPARVPPRVGVLRGARVAGLLRLGGGGRAALALQSSAPHTQGP